MSSSKVVSCCDLSSDRFRKESVFISDFPFGNETLVRRNDCVGNDLVGEMNVCRIRRGVQGFFNIFGEFGPVSFGVVCVRVSLLREPEVVFGVKYCDYWKMIGTECVKRVPCSSVVEFS